MMLQAIGYILVDLLSSDGSKTSATSSNPSSKGASAVASLQGGPLAEREAASKGGVSSTTLLLSFHVHLMNYTIRHDECYDFHSCDIFE